MTNESHDSVKQSADALMSHNNIDPSDEATVESETEGDTHVANEPNIIDKVNDVLETSASHTVSDSLIICGECNMNFRSEWDAATHIKTHNQVLEVVLNEEAINNATVDVNISDGPQEKVENQYLCEYCTYITSEIKHLKNHNASVHEAANRVEFYCCDVCNYRTEQTSDLREH